MKAIKFTQTLSKTLNLKTVVATLLKPYRQYARASLFVLAFSLNSYAQNGEIRGLLEIQRKAFAEAVARGDAARVAKLFTTDAKLMVPGLETVTGREAIQRFWQGGLGMIKGISFAPADFTGENEGLVVETGNIKTLDEGGKEKDQSRYLVVWKREDGEWRIHRDIVNSELAPAPKEDRVGFPKDYPTKFSVLGVPVRTNTPSSLVLTAYGNDLAASVTNQAQLPYPNGSIVLMEFAHVRKDSDGKQLFDANGLPQKGEVHHVDVMRRGKGFGDAYGSNRSGEWEYAGYFPDGSYSTPPAKTASCAQCHQRAGAKNDFVFPLRAQEPIAR
jgi:uncharacterized protein (TIGR02246 family)